MNPAPPAATSSPNRISSRCSRRSPPPARRLLAGVSGHGGRRTRAGPLRNLESENVADQHKRIVICADGTWNMPQQSAHGGPSPTNVWLLWKLVNDRSASNMPQLAYYHPGVGTGGILNRVVGGINGFGLRRNILECYRFIVEQYRPGDYLYLFGFSRGAYTVRSLAGLIRNSGIIRRDRFPAGEARDAAIAAAWALYRHRGQDTTPVAEKAVDFRARHSHPDFRITCMGVWDTVGALGIPVGGLLGWLSRHWFGFHDVKLSSYVDRGFHAVAVDERRGPFVPTLWEQQPNAKELGQHMEQVWFPGVHADVGGGYGWAERGLANLTLRWMVNRVTQCCGLELDAESMENTPPAELALHDCLHWYYRLPFMAKPLTRVLDGGLGQTGSRDPGRLTLEQVHPSVGWCRTKFCPAAMPLVGRPYAPANVTDYHERLARPAARRRAQKPYPPDVKQLTATDAVLLRGARVTAARPSPVRPSGAQS